MLCNDCVSSLMNDYVYYKVGRMLTYFCFSLLRNELLEGDFGTNVKLLQNFPPIDINVVLSKAVELKA